VCGAEEEDGSCHHNICHTKRAQNASTRLFVLLTIHFGIPVGTLIAWESFYVPVPGTM